MTFNECMDFINSYTKSGARITDLSRAENLMKLINNPEKKLKFIHIAGTNGKGSTLEYISNTLILSGYKTGQFTSPFVLHYTDRIRINNIDIDEQSLCKICEFLKNKIDSQPYSQFEITMAIAFIWFEQQNCDVVVLETGIGGLLDCTNVIPPPLVSVITSVSLDHTSILGNTVEEIAVHKAGIIKENSAVVIATDNTDENVLDVIRKSAAEKNAEIIPNEPCKPAFDGGIISQFIYKGQNYKPAMFGIHQYHNAQTALTVCIYLKNQGFNITDENIKKSIETSQVKARIQYIEGNPPVIVDGGHNFSGISMLSLVLMYLSTRNKKIYTVMGMIDSKDYEECVKVISQQSDMFFATDGFAPNSVKAENIENIAGFYSPTEIHHSLKEAVLSAEKFALENNGIVVICGSLYLASTYLNDIAK